MEKYMGLKVHKKPVDHIRWEDIKQKLTPEQWDKFQLFMTGQTCILAGVYPWDFQRWIDEGMKDRQGPNWD